MTKTVSFDKAFDLIEPLRRSTTASELRAAFVRATKSISDCYIASGRVKGGAPVNAETALVTYPDAWLKHYHERKYLDIDPTIVNAGRSYVPYRWEALQDISVKQRQMFLDIAETGIKGGITMSLHTPDRAAFVTSFAFTKAVSEDRDLVALGFINSQYYETLSKLSEAELPGPVPTFSRREKECLLWVSRGKTTWDISVILGISENTINAYLKNVILKLGCSGRIQAVLRAIDLNLISP
ncbi:autoinducer binding domain-containing protein [Gluconacetobacter diazotrophicus]|uniref:Putative transcriptional regulator, luxR family n=1 Tax=Gluconacetobacter diazotrophicus (strain ATCC 49037 / DSM 5601 / CCUG 37298 / CIP 103539 / LMG 7603 / PAl5) TaxID=272568 RepID=A9HQR0_GLUDA|nr:autoinducer binding domain-containing protein [Gluconacetobacter diazotrophicus]CAP56781.1 putative transcriptional regulator, luxR family [Gluconacetobacter diazotrophicus PA1 5]